MDQEVHVGALAKQVFEVFGALDPRGSYGQPYEPTASLLLSDPLLLLHRT